MSKRKVIIIGPAFPFRGGIANFNNALAQAYHDRGDNITLYSFTLQYPSFLFPGTTQYETGEAPKNLKIKTLINSVNPFNWIQVARKINKENPDYIIIRYWLPFMAPCLGSIARLLNKKIKILAITDNVIPHEKRMGDTIFTKYFIKSCDAFLTLSASVLDDLSKFTKTTVKKYIPHPIYDVFGEKIAKEKAIKNLGLNPEDKHLLFFGFVRKYKGLDLMLQTMADNRIKEMEIKLIIAGEFYDDKKEYTDMINDLGIADNIIMKSDFIPADKVKSYFCASDMITQTYRTATQSGVTQIAYSFDRPMLVTDVGGLAEIVPNNKVGYVTSQNPTSIADAIVDFYTNNKEAEFTINTGAEKKRFSWGSFVNGIEDLML
ncbi:MAG TPA: glycosyltransferase [Flavobacteriales bacterium]|nr:glycosyltransferase [Flavobacteriales bacterium]HIL66299.1 glycosyltransferase [Flavobacteriales bacterium]